MLIVNLAPFDLRNFKTPLFTFAVIQYPYFQGTTKSTYTACKFYCLVWLLLALSQWRPSQITNDVIHVHELISIIPLNTFGKMNYFSCSQTSKCMIHLQWHFVCRRRTFYSDWKEVQAMAVVSCSTPDACSSSLTLVTWSLSSSSRGILSLFNEVETRSDMLVRTFAFSRLYLYFLLSSFCSLVINAGFCQIKYIPKYLVVIVVKH